MSNRELPAIAKVLINAKKRIATKETWCQGKLYGFGSGPRQMCALGALYLEFNTGSFTEVDGKFFEEPMLIAAREALDRVAAELYPDRTFCKYRGIAYVNDKIGLDAVHRCFDLAIQREIQL